MGDGGKPRQSQLQGHADVSVVWAAEDEPSAGS